MKIHASGEDYLEAILVLQKKMGMVRSIDLARHMGFSKPSKESVQWEIAAGNRTGTVEQMDANVEAMARDLQEILRIGAEQKRLWEVYER